MCDPKPECIDPPPTYSIANQYKHESADHKQGNACVQSKNQISERLVHGDLNFLSPNTSGLQVPQLQTNPASNSSFSHPATARHVNSLQHQQPRYEQ